MTPNPASDPQVMTVMAVMETGRRVEDVVVIAGKGRPRGLWLKFAARDLWHKRGCRWFVDLPRGGGGIARATKMLNLFSEPATGGHCRVQRDCHCPSLPMPLHALTCSCPRNRGHGESTGRINETKRQVGA